MSRPIPVRPVSVALLAILSMAACSVNIGGGGTRIGAPPYDRGSGRVVTESRPLSSFHAVTVSQGLVVSISNGSSASAKVTADDNLMAHLTTEVHAGTLFVGVTGSIQTSTTPRVAVTTSSAIDALGANFGATLDTEDLQATDLTVTATSGATVRAAGKANSLDLIVDTGATADLRNVELASAHVRLTTGSTAYVNAHGTVSGSCVLGSVLHVRGVPARQDVSVDVSSSVKAE